MTEKCNVCARDPERMNGELSECSHVECPHRRRAWSDKPSTHQRTDFAEVNREERHLRSLFDRGLF
jgi:hypothetical protein